MFSTSFSQSREKAIREGFTKWNEAMIAQNFEKSTDYVADEMFTLLSKEQFVGMMQMMFKNPKLEIVLTMPEILSISDATKVNDKFYFIINTKSMQKLRFFDDDGTYAKLEDSVIAQQTYTTWKNQLGEENVSYDEETAFFTLKVTQKVLSLSPDGKTSWKYLGVDENTKMMLKQIIPEEVMSKL